MKWNGWWLLAGRSRVACDSVGLYIDAVARAYSTAGANPMSKRLVLVMLASTCLAAALAACSSAPLAPQAVLDEHTGLTINAVAEPMLFARVRGDVATSTRDYVTVVAMESDNAGRFTQLLLMYRWSVSFKGRAAPPPENSGRLVIQLDGRELELNPLDRIPLDLSQNKALFVPDGPNVQKYAYLTDFDTMRAIASSHQLAVRLPQDSPDTPLPLWRDGRTALMQLVQQLNGS